MRPAGAGATDRLPRTRARRDRPSASPPPRRRPRRAGPSAVPGLPVAQQPLRPPVLLGHRLLRRPRADGAARHPAPHPRPASPAPRSRPGPAAQGRRRRRGRARPRRPRRRRRHGGEPASGPASVARPASARASRHRRHARLPARGLWLAHPRRRRRHRDPRRGPCGGLRLFLGPDRGSRRRRPRPAGSEPPGGAFRRQPRPPARGAARQGSAHSGPSFSSSASTGRERAATSPWRRSRCCARAASTPG